MTSKPKDITELVIAAKLDKQFRCVKCNALLVAFGKDFTHEWSCVECNVPEATIAIKDTEAKD